MQNAYIEFGCNDPITGEEVVTRVTMPNEAMHATVQAVCASENYTGDAPGLYVINRAMAGWDHDVEVYNAKIANEQAVAAVAAALAPLKVRTTTVNGVEV